MHEQYLRAIQETYPDFVITSVRANSEGQFNDVLFVNDEFVFRFPRYPEGVTSLAVEVAILNSLRGCLSLGVPDPLFVSTGVQTVGHAFMGYRLIPGEPLWNEVVNMLDRAALQRVAKQLATFLHELHTFDFEGLRLDASNSDAPAVWIKMYADIRQHLFPFMRPDAQDWVTRHFEDYLGSLRLHDYKLSLRHDDFGTSNILYDPDARLVTGIIDFSMAALAIRQRT